MVTNPGCQLLLGFPAAIIMQNQSKQHYPSVLKSEVGKPRELWPQTGVLETNDDWLIPLLPY